MKRSPEAGFVALGVLMFGMFSLGAAPASPPVDSGRLQDPTPAPTLAAYHLFTDVGGRTPNAGLTPYGLNTPLFSDYAKKQRYIYMPLGKRAQYRPTGVLELPVGAVLVKTFAYPADFRKPKEKVRFIETRLLIHRTSGWIPLTYVWNDAQTEAVLKRAGMRTEIIATDAKGAPLTFSYAVPNVNQCKECHELGDALTPIGPKARNLNGDYAYDGGVENQLAHWTRIGLLDGAPSPSVAPKTPHWDDVSVAVQARAFAYLDANCAHCHNPRAPPATAASTWNTNGRRPWRGASASVRWLPARPPPIWISTSRPVNQTSPSSSIGWKAANPA